MENLLVSNTIAALTSTSEVNVVLVSNDEAAVKENTAVVGEATAVAEAATTEVTATDSTTTDTAVDEAATTETATEEVAGEAVTDETAATDETAVTEETAVTDEAAADTAVDETMTGDVAVDGSYVDPTMNTGEGMLVDPGMTTVKEPLLASWPFVIGISAAVLFVSVVLGILLARRKIKKGIELYED